MHKSTEYKFKLLDSSGNVICDQKEERLNIGYVYRGGFSQINGRGEGFAMLLQPESEEYD